MNDGRERDKVKERKGVKLEWRDYVAIGIAALQTILLPFVLLLFAIIVISILFRLLIFR